VLVLVALCWLASKHRRAVSWRLVAVGVAMQFAIGGLFVAWSTGRDALYRFGEGVRDFLALSAAGTRFVFGPLADGAAGSSLGFVLATQALPVLIFFSSLMAVLYHLGVMQLVVHGMARVTARVLGTSGAESLSACGNVFVGQTEAPMMVRPFLGSMTVSELH